MALLDDVISREWNKNFPVPKINEWGYSLPFLIMFTMFFYFRIQSPAVLALLIYLIHQFEEHAYPGGFGPFINKNIFKQKNNISYDPLSPTFIFLTNSIAIWLIFLVVAFVLYQYDYRWLAIPLSIMTVNAFTHIMGALVFRKYNPGLITAVFLLLPISLYLFYTYFTKNDNKILLMSFAVAIFIHLFILMYGFRLIFMKN
jgi:hypothetical protein